MNWTKLKYKTKVLLSPSLWPRNHTANKDFDTWPWNKLEEGTSIFEPHYYFSIMKSLCHVKYAGKPIWIKNAPYADVQCEVGDFYLHSSRATALRFRELYQEYLRKEENKQFHKEFGEDSVLIRWL